MARISPLWTENETSLKYPVRESPSTRRISSPIATERFGKNWVISRPTMAMIEILVPDLVEVPGADEAGVAEDRHAAGEAIHVFHAMRDEDDGDALVAQALGDLVEVFAFTVGERRGRLIHDDDPCIRGERLPDLDDLLLGDRETAHRRAGIEVSVQSPQQLLGPVPCRSFQSILRKRG